MKIKLYVDFDGVILNTIDITYSLLGGIDLNDVDAVKDFYINLDWNDLLNRSEPIQNSVNNLKKIIKSDLYDVAVLSHVISDAEKKAKAVYLKENFGNIKFVPVDRDLNKCDVVDCKGAVLVDDYMGNLQLWDNKGGIPIKFSDKGKKHKYLTVTSLADLLDMYDDLLEVINIYNS